MPEQQDNPQTPKADDLTGLRCPKCDYDLRGLLHHECPECGISINAQEIRAAINQINYRVDWYARAIFVYSVISLAYCTIVRVLVSNDGWLFTHFPYLASRLHALIFFALLACVLWGVVMGPASVITLMLAVYRRRNEAVGFSLISLMLILTGAWLALTMIKYLA